MKLHPANEIKNLKKRLRKARRFPENTCPASRHTQMIGEALPTKKGYPMLQEEPEHCAGSLLSTVAALYEARTEIARWKQSYAGWCVLMMDQGVKSFGTLEQAFKKLTKLRKQERAAAAREESK